MVKKKQMSQIRIEAIELYKLHPTEWNPRKISDKERADLKKSLEKFGCIEPLVIRSEDMTIVGGHQRYTAALELGWTEMPCVKISGLSDDEAKLLNIGLNKIHGEWDIDKLSGVIDELRLSGADISLSGFDNISLENMGIAGKDSAGGGISLPDGEKNPIEKDLEQITFVVTTMQLEEIKRALARIGESDCYSEEQASGNSNKNGNAITLICRARNEQSQGLSDKDGEG